MRACDYAVYRINYTDRIQVRTEDEFVRWDENVPCKYLCVAPTQEFALAAFRRYHGSEHVKNVVVELVGSLNDLVYLQ